MGDPDRACLAVMSSKALQVLAQYRGIQQRKNRTTMTTSMRITRFLASSLASDVLVRGLSALVARVEEDIADISIECGRWTTFT